MDIHVLFILLLSIGTAVQSKPKLCSGVNQKDGEVQREDEVSSRSFNRLSIFRPGLLFRGGSSTEDPQSNNKRPGNTGLLHGSGGVANGGYGMIHGGGEKQILSRNRIFGQGVGLRNNSLSQKIGNLLNYQNFGILSGNSVNVNRTHQNNSGPSYQVFLPSGLHQTNSVGGQAVGSGGSHGGSTGGGLLNHGHRPHLHHVGGPAIHQGGHLSGLLGHHTSHPLHSLHPLTLHSHHGGHGLAALGNGGILGARPGHHHLNGGILGATHISGGGGGPLHGKPGGVGLIHGGLGGGGQTPGNIIGHRPLTHGTLGLIHSALGHQGLTSNSGGGNTAQSQHQHGGLLGLIQNGLGAQGLLIGGVGGNNHYVGGSGLSSGQIFGPHGVFNLVHGGHSGTQGGNFQTVTGSELKPGHVYLHLGTIGGQPGVQSGGTVDNSLQSAGGSTIGSGQVYGQGPVYIQSGQGSQGQGYGVGNNYQTGGQTGGTVDNSFQSAGGSSIGSGQVYGQGPVYIQSGQGSQGQVYGTGNNYQTGGQTSGTIDNNFQSAGGSSSGSGQVYGQGVQGQSYGTVNNYQTGGQTGGAVDNSFQSAGGSSIGSGQVYGQGGQGAQGQVHGTGNNYQIGGTGASQSGQFQSQHNLHQGAFSQGGATAITSNSGGYGVAPGQQSYQGSTYETQWSTAPAVDYNAGSTHAAGTVGSSGNLNSYNQASQGSNNFVSGNNVQSLYANQNSYDGSTNQYGTQLTSGNYYNSGKIPITTDNVGVYGFNQAAVHNQTLGQGNIAGGSLTQHSHQSSSSSSLVSNSSSEEQESSSQQTFFTGGNLVGVNTGSTTTSVVEGQPLSTNHVGGDQSLQQNQFNGNAQGQSNYISGTNYLQNIGGGIGQYMGDYGSAAFSGSYPHPPDNKNANDQKQGNYAHGSIIYVIQQAPLADEEIFTGENEASVSGSTTGSGSFSGSTSSSHNNQLPDKTSSVSGGFGSGISASQNSLGTNSALAGNEVQYGGTTSSSSLQSGNHGSTSTQFQHTSGNVSPAGSSSHSINSSPSLGSSGSSGSTGTSYNTQYSQPTFGSAASQSTGSGTQQYVGSNANPQYGSINSAAVSGQVGSSSFQNNSGYVLPGGSSSHSVNSSPSLGGSGSSGSSGSSYNTQYSQPTLGSAASQSTGSSSQHYISSNSNPQYRPINSAVVTGEVGSSSLSSGASSTNGNSFPNVNKENGVGGSVTDSKVDIWQSSESGASAGSSNGGALSTQTSGQGQYASTGSISSSSHMSSLTNNGLSVNTSGSNSRPTKPASSSLTTNQALVSGVGHTSSFPSSSTSVSSSHTGESHGAGSSTQINTMAQYGNSGTRDTPSSITMSTNNGNTFEQTESLGSSVSASNRPSNVGGHQSSAITPNAGSSQQHQISGSSPSTGSLVGGESGYVSSHGGFSSNYASSQMSSANTVAAGSPSSHFTALGNSDHSSTHGSTVHGGSNHFSTIGQGANVASSSSINRPGSFDMKTNNASHDKTGNHMINQVEVNTGQGSSSSAGQYTDNFSSVQAGNSNNEASSSSFGTMYQSSVSGSTNPHTEGVSFVSSSNNPASNSASSISDVGGVHSVGSSASQMYVVSSNEGGYGSSSVGHGNQASSFAVQTNSNDKLTSLNSEANQNPGLMGSAGTHSQNTLNTAPSGSSSFIASQSSTANSERNPETFGSSNNEQISLGTTQQTSNQYSNLNQLSMTSSTLGESGSYELVNDKQMISSGSLVSGGSGSAVYEASENPTSTSNTQQSISANHGDNQLFSSSSSNFGGTGNHLSSPTTSQHHGSGVYTSGGNTEINSNINGYGSLPQGHSSVGLTTGSGINKEVTGSVQTTSFRYPGQYTYKYGYVPPNNVYTRVGYPPTDTFNSQNIVYRGDVSPNTEQNGFYYHYSTARNPVQITSIEIIPDETNVQENLNEQTFAGISEQSIQLPLASNVDEEDDTYEETPTNNGIKGNIQGHFEHSGGGSFEGGISRPFQGGLSFTGNHELNTGISGGVSGHLGSVGNFQGFLGNAANKVGGIISGVGHAVGIIRDEGDSKTQGGHVDSQGDNIGAQQQVQGSLTTNNQHQAILAPFSRAQGDLQVEHAFPIYFQEHYGSGLSKTFLDGKNISPLLTSTLDFPPTIVPLRESKVIRQEEDDNLNSEVVESFTSLSTSS